MGAERAAALERLGQVKVDDAMPVFLRHGGRASVGQRGYRSLNGVTDAVDQHVEMAEFGQHLLCQQVHVCGLGGVPVEGQALPAHRPDFLGYGVGPDGRQSSHCHVGASLTEGQRNALADASSLPPHTGPSCPQRRKPEGSCQHSLSNLYRIDRKCRGASPGRARGTVVDGPRYGLRLR